MAEPESILQLGIEAARDGNKEEARSLFRLLTRQEPRNAQAWLWLAGVAETRDERQAALEQVVEIEPTNDMAIKGLQALGVRPGSRSAAPAPVAPAPAPAAPAASAYSDFDDDDPFAELDALADVMADGPAAARRDPPPVTEQFDASDDDGLDSLSTTPPARTTTSTTTTSRTTSSRPTTTFSTSNRLSSSSRPSPRGDEGDTTPNRVSPLALVIGALLLLGFLVGGYFLLNQLFGGNQQATNPTAPAATADPGLAPTDDPLAGTGVVSPTAELPTTPPEQPTEAVPPTPEPPAGDPALSAIPAIVPPNTPLDSNGWSYNFSQPNYATSIIGALNGIQPQGRFVVVLVLVSNTTGQGQVVPGDFFVLKDGQGRVYNSQPSVSTAYVIPGVNADLSQEQPIPADGASYSVALLFDVAPDATSLVFFARSKPDQGWQVLSAV
jgi:hypothetical protein